jgi:hypothetical protein
MGDDRMIMLDVHCCVLAKGECVKREPEPRREEIVGEHRRPVRLRFEYFPSYVCVSRLEGKAISHEPVYPRGTTGD